MERFLRKYVIFAGIMILNFKSYAIWLASSLIGIFSTFHVVKAQDSLARPMPEKANYVKIEIFSIGASVDLASSGGKANAELVGSRQNVAFSSNFRLTHLFSSKLGWYAALKLDLLKEKKSPYYDGIPVGEMLMQLFYGGYTPAVAAEGGLVYRIEKGRWDIHPRMGFGYGIFLLDRDSDKSKPLENGTVQRNVYTQRASGALLSLGLSSHYFINKRSFLSFNIGFQQPLKSSYGQLDTFLNDVPAESKRYSSAGIGRDLNFGVGYGFTIGKRKL